jgi:ABC-2 type transport system permease protein
VTALARSEWLKLRTTRGWWAYLGVIVVLSGIAAAGDTGSSDDARRSTLDFQLGLVEVGAIAALLALVLGITAVTVEFRHGTVTPTFLITPVRERVLTAKAVVVALVSLLFAVLALAVVAAVALPWLSVVGAELHLGEGELWRRVAQTLLAAVLWGLMGVAVGSLVHSQIAGLVGTLIWIFVGESLVWGLLSLVDLDGAGAYLPFRALDAADGTGGEDLLSYWPGIVVSLAWIAAIGAAGVVRTRRRDIT